jgi:hypothetical protein
MYMRSSDWGAGVSGSKLYARDEGVVRSVGCLTTDHALVIGRNTLRENRVPQLIETLLWVGRERRSLQYLI